MPTSPAPPLSQTAEGGNGTGLWPPCRSCADRPRALSEGSDVFPIRSTRRCCAPLRRASYSLAARRFRGTGKLHILGGTKLPHPRKLIQSVKTKRYAYARISRILLCALLGITRDMVSAHNSEPASYVRVLAVRDASVMSALAKAASVPLITSAASPLYPALDAAATGVWALSQTAPPYDKADRDFTQRLFI